jgi:hypothetical protein
MSHRHKNLERGVKAELVERIVPPRKERHGKPVSVRRRAVVTNPLTGAVEVQYSQGTPAPDRTARVAAGSTGTYGARNVPPDRKGSR